MQEFAHDLRWAARFLFTDLGITSAAVLALALGIGANSAIFSIINAVLLRPLPYRDADRLMVLWENKLSKGIQQVPVSPPDYTDFVAQNQVFDHIGAFRRHSAVLIGKELPERVEAASVSPSLFELLGLKPALGRTFAPGEDQPAQNSVVVLSDGLWRRHYGADRNVLGAPLILDGKSYTIIGIAPPEFRLLDTHSELWIPYTPEPSELSPLRRGYHSLTVFAHLKPSVTQAQAQIDVQAVAQRIAAMSPDTNAGYSAKIIPLRDQIVGDLRPTLWTLTGAVAFVLLIACTDVANLLLARAGAREKEIAVRAAVGANPARIVRQMLTEGLLLAATGGAFGLLLARWALSVLVSLAPSNIPRAQDIPLDWRVLAFTLGVSLVAGLLFGLAPALASVQTDLSSILKSSGRGASEHRARGAMRDLLVIFEISCCVVLLIGAGLLIRSFALLQQVKPGFRTDHVLSMQISPAPARYSGLKLGLFYKQLLDGLMTLPGAQSVGICRFLPLNGEDIGLNFQIEGRPALSSADQPRAKFRAAGGDYFKALGIPLLKGRLFDRSDNERSPKVVIINQTAAERYWPNEEPVGRRILSGIDESQRSVIIGVVGNVKYTGLDAETEPETYYQYLQIPPEVMNFAEPTMSIVVRTNSDPAAVTSSIRKQVQALDPQQAVYNIRTMEEVAQRSVAQPRFRTLLLGLFAGLALLLAVIGLYALIAHSVTQRLQELGIRMTLGATRSDILQMVIWKGLRLALVGALIGVALAFACTQLISKLLFGVAPADPTTFVATCALILAVASIASFVPALMATRIDPATALRTE